MGSWAREAARLLCDCSEAGREGGGGVGSEAVWSQGLSLGSRVPHRHVLQPLPRKAVPMGRPCPPMCLGLMWWQSFRHLHWGVGGGR